MKPNNLHDSLYLFPKIIKLLVIFLLLTFGCNHQINSQEKTENLTSKSQISSPVTQISSELFQTEIKATKHWKIADILKTSPKETYWRDVKKGAETAALDFGVYLTIISPDQPQTTEFVEDQIMLMANLIKTGRTDGIIIGFADSIRLVPVVEKAISKGIPVIAMPAPLNSDKILTFVGFDNFAAGKSIGEWVVKKLGGKGKVLILNDTPNHNNAIAHRQGFIEGLKTENIRIIATESANWEQSEARSISAKWLKKFHEVDAIIAGNDSMALGASQAVEAANYQGIIITGFDGIETGLQGIKKGQIAATVNQAPKQQARLAIQLMIRHLQKGEIYPNIVLLQDLEMVTSENLGNYLSSPSVNPNSKVKSQ